MVDLQLQNAVFLKAPSVPKCRDNKENLKKLFVQVRVRACVVNYMTHNVDRKRGKIKRKRDTAINRQK